MQAGHPTLMHERLGSELLWRVAAVSGGLVALRCTCKGANELLSDAAVEAAVLKVMPELTWLGGGDLRELWFAAKAHVGCDLPPTRHTCTVSSHAHSLSFHVGAPPPPARCSRMRPALSALASDAVFNS